MSGIILDVIVIIVLLTSAVLAMVRGLVREVLSIAAWGSAAAAAYFFHEPIVPMVKPFVETGIVATIIAAAVIFFIALVVASYLTMRISDFVLDGRVGALDQFLGFFFGAARGVLLVVVAFLFFQWLTYPSLPWVSQANSKPILENIGQLLISALPEDLEAALQKYMRHDDDPGSSSEPPTIVDEGAEREDINYGSGTRQGLDQLIENSEPARQ